jgi:hypothetical protein
MSSTFACKLSGAWFHNQPIMGVAQSTEWRMAMRYIRMAMAEQPERKEVPEAGKGTSTVARPDGEPIRVACLPTRLQRLRPCPDDFPSALRAAWALGKDIGVLQLEEHPDEIETEEREKDVDAPDETVAADWEKFVLCEGAQGLAIFPRFGRVVVMSANDDTGLTAPSAGLAQSIGRQDVEAGDVGAFVSTNVYVPGTVTGGLRPASEYNDREPPAQTERGVHAPHQTMPATLLVPPQAPMTRAQKGVAKSRRERTMDSLSALAP